MQTIIVNICDIIVTDAVCRFMAVSSGNTFTPLFSTACKHLR